MQNFKNHSRYNIAHHFIIMPLTGALLAWPFVRFAQDKETLANTLFHALLALTLLLVSLVSRSYALKNQDRIIRAEMRQRYFELSAKSFSTMEKQLELKQIIALRFAGNGELLELIDRTIREKLAPKDIKSAIQDWQSDNNRV